MAGWIVLSLFGLLAMCGASADADYYIGAGRYDVTGPAAEVEMVRDTFAREQWVGLSRSFLFLLFVFELYTHVEDTCITLDIHALVFAPDLPPPHTHTHTHTARWAMQCPSRLPTESTSGSGVVLL